MSYVELAVKRELVETLIQQAIEYLRSETKSKETGMAVKLGLRTCPELRGFARRARDGIVTVEEALAAAKKSRVRTYEITGQRGLIGAVASLGMMECPPEKLMDVNQSLN
jgi:tRNA(Ile2) C34 agmatinyltransferase TiaS